MPGVLDNTFFKNVRNFPPGNYMLFKNGKIKIKNFGVLKKNLKIHLILRTIKVQKKNI